MKTRIIGDIHGLNSEYFKVIKDAEASVQVGDFGLGFYGFRDSKTIAKLAKTPQHRFIRGNHDDPAVCLTSPNFIGDVVVENSTMYIGGAWSIDWAMRVEGISWWRDEELSIGALNSAISIYEVAQPRIMITHDTATSAATEMFFGPNGYLRHFGFPKKTRTAEAMQTMFELHQPKVWFFGHWHKSLRAEINGTHFVCLDEMDYINIDLNGTDEELYEAIKHIPT